MKFNVKHSLFKVCILDEKYRAHALHEYATAAREHVQAHCPVGYRTAFPPGMQGDHGSKEFNDYILYLNAVLNFRAIGRTDLTIDWHPTKSHRLMLASTDWWRKKGWRKFDEQA